MFSKKSSRHSRGRNIPLIWVAKDDCCKEDITSKYFEAYTYGYLPSGVKWEMHEHDNIVEICVVTMGKGIVRDSQGNEEAFIAGDRFIFPSNIKTRDRKQFR